MANSLYPTLDIPLIEDPTRWYAIPVFGGLIKGFMLIPVFIWFVAIGFAALFMTVFINSFVVLFTGKYWKVSYEINVLLINFIARVSYFWTGLTNDYPFSEKAKKITVDVPYPKNPNRFFAVPIIGGLARGIILIPFFIYISIIGQASNLANMLASIPVLLMGQFPESCYELIRDNIRLTLALSFYGYGLEDKYPSFWISMNHKTAKIIFIILGTILFLLNNVGRFSNNNSYRNSYQQQYQNQYQPPTNNTY
jgi:hypothetical protein